jgi:hypothetical protein
MSIKLLSSQVLEVREKEILRLCSEIENIAIKAGKIALPKAIKAGQLLTEVKEGIPHGSWMDWIEVNFEFGKSTAENYMRLYREHGAQIPNGVGNITLREAIKLLPPVNRKPSQNGNKPHQSTNGEVPAPAVLEDSPARSWKRPSEDLAVESEVETAEAVKPISQAVPVQQAAFPVAHDEPPSPRTYQVECTVTIRVIRHEDARDENDAIRRVKGAHGAQLERYLLGYVDCEKVEIDSMEWKAQ